MRARQFLKWLFSRVAKFIAVLIPGFIVFAIISYVISLIPVSEDDFYDVCCGSLLIVLVLGVGPYMAFRTMRDKWRGLPVRPKRRKR